MYLLISSPVTIGAEEIIELQESDRIQSALMQGICLSDMATVNSFPMFSRTMILFSKSIFLRSLFADPEIQLCLPGKSLPSCEQSIHPALHPFASSGYL